MNFLRFGQQGGQTDKTNHAIFFCTAKADPLCGDFCHHKQTAFLRFIASLLSQQVQKSQTHMRISLLCALLFIRIPFFGALVKVEKRWYNRKEVDFCRRMCHEFHPPASAHGIFPAGRRVPHSKARRAHQGAWHDLLCHHRPRRDVRLHRLLFRHEGCGHQAHHRLRGLRLPRPAGQIRREPRVQSPHPPVRKQHRLSEPDETGQRGLPDRLLLSPAH